MTNRSPSYKLSRQPSVQRQFQDQDEAPHAYIHHTPKHPQFFTEKKINLHSKGYGHRHGDDDDERNENKRVRFASGIKGKNEDQLSVLDEHERLEYSSTDQLSQLSNMLAGLGARSGHSFEKEKIDFSLSCDVLDTQHENMLLKKKMNEMKKELKYLRDHDEKTFAEIMDYQQRTEEGQTAVLSLKHELQLSRRKMVQMERLLNQKDETIEELQKLVSSNSPSKHNEGKVSIMVQEVQNAKQLARKYQEQLHNQRHYYEKELFQNSKKYTAHLEEVNAKFEHAKSVGQKQIDDLIARIAERDQQIIRLRSRIGHLDFTCKMSTLVSDGFEQRDHLKTQPHPQSHLQPHSCRRENPNIVKYLNRFIQFSQYIDQKIHKSCEKNKNQREGRASKSAVVKPPPLNKMNEYRQRMPESPPNVNNSFKISELLEKNELFKRQNQQVWHLA